MERFCVSWTVTIAGIFVCATGCGSVSLLPESNTGGADSSGHYSLGGSTSTGLQTGGVHMGGESSSSGSTGDTYSVHISSIEQFLYELTANPGGSFVLNGDLDFTSSAPIDSFTGTLDGQGHTLANFSYNSSLNEANAGIFRTVSGSIRNVVVANCNIVSYAQHVGCLVGTLSGTVTNAGVTSGHVTCTGDININTAWACGGLIGGLMPDAVVDQDFSLIDVSGGQVYAAGSLAGGDPAGSGESKFAISNSYATGNVTSNYLTGGLVGGLGGGYGVVTLLNCFAYGAARPTSSQSWTPGGLIGMVNYCHCTSSYYNGDQHPQGPCALNWHDQTPCGNALTSTEFTNKSKFVNWDFGSTWDMSDRYPVLRQ